MEEIICSQNINSTIFCYSMDFSGISKQNAHGGWNVLPKMFVGRWWYFLEKCWKTGWSEQDVRDRRMLPWMATGAVPVRIRTATHFSSENSHRETLHRGRMSRPPWAFVGFTATLRYEPCIQFINVSQRTLHIYFIDGCHRIKIERNNLLCEQAPTEVFRSIFAWLVTLKLKNHLHILPAVHEGGYIYRSF